MERDIAPRLASWVVAGGFGQKDNIPSVYRKPEPERSDGEVRQTLTGLRRMSQEEPQRRKCFRQLRGHLENFGLRLGFPMRLGGKSRCRRTHRGPVDGSLALRRPAKHSRQYAGRSRTGSH